MPPSLKILLNDAETMSALALSSEDLEWLISTKQLNLITIRGNRLFLASDLKALVETYRVVQKRGHNETPEYP